MSLLITLAVVWFYSVRVVDKDSVIISSGKFPKGLTVGVEADSANYAWIGNQWVPPHNIPMYRPSQIREVWSKYDVLFLGDSTARQDWGTLAGILLENNDVQDSNGNNNNNVMKTSLSKYINEGKGMTKNCTLHRRYRSNIQCKHHSTETKKLDCVDGFSCFKNTTSRTTDVEAGDEERRLLAKEYDAVIISMGIWEVVRPSACFKSTRTLEQRVDDMLYMMKHISSPQLHIIWKTIGSAGQNTTEKINDIARRWFLEQQDNDEHNLAYMHLVDWGKQILPRSVGANRIHGDLKPHWGVEARTLSIQMITHILDILHSS